MNVLTHEHHDLFAEEVDHEKARREFLTCTLGAETYGIDILKVQEIRMTSADMGLINSAA